MTETSAKHLQDAARALEEKAYKAAYDSLLEVCAHSDHFMDLNKAGQLFRKLKAASDTPVGPETVVRVAILGGMTTLYLSQILQSCALARGLAFEIYEAEYNTIDIEVRDPSSRLHAFKPDVVLCLPVQEHVQWDAEGVVESEQTRWTGLWSLIEQQLKARVVQLLFDEDSGEENLFLGLTSPRTKRYQIRDLNQKLVASASANTSLVDYAGIVAFYGRENWFNRKTWYLAKQPIAMPYLSRLARHLVATIGTGYGRSKRVIAVDLDNTLWGGILGEEDVHGVKVGQGEAESEQFLDFQKYLLELSRQGCVLVVVSKNDEPLVRECFDKRKEDMALQWSDFSAARVNWIDKAENIRSLSQELSLPLEHFVFIDDNPTERGRVRQALPEVTVPELPADPGGYRRAVEKLLLFERRGITTEDLLRKESYQSERLRQDMQKDAGSLDSFLDSLQMVLEGKKLDSSLMERAVQLMSKTNQFNLTTIRYSAAELGEMCESEDVFPMCYRLVDRFGDYGWIGIMLLKKQGTTAVIDTWLMSCRVLGKTVEQGMLQDAVNQAKAWGCTELRGTYIRTKKNGMVSDLYPRMGFSERTAAEDRAEYVLDCQVPAQAPGSFLRRKQDGLTQ